MREELLRDPTILRGHEDAARLTEIYHVTFGETLKGFLAGKAPEEVVEIYERIGPCSCGCDRPVGVETETMGDYDFEISCPECGRVVRRSMYDFDVTEKRDWIDACVEDWNCGKVQADIEETIEAERRRVTLTTDDLEWLPLYPNNSKENGKTGEYCMLFRRDSDGEMIGLKWTITFQRKEIEPGLTSTDSEIEAYALFRKTYPEIVGELSHPEPTDETSYDEAGDLDSTLNAFEVNSYGDFMHAYRTLEEAKVGAAARCSWSGYDRDVIVRTLDGRIERRGETTA